MQVLNKYVLRVCYLLGTPLGIGVPNTWKLQSLLFRNDTVVWWMQWQAPKVQWEHDGGGEAFNSDGNSLVDGFTEEMTLGPSSAN